VGRALCDGWIAQWGGHNGIAQWKEHYGMVG